MVAPISNIINKVRKVFVLMTGTRSSYKKYLIKKGNVSPEHMFIRKRHLLFADICAFLINIMSKSLAIEIDHNSDILNYPTVSKQDFSYRRSFISAQIFTDMNKKFLNDFYTEDNSLINYWNGFLLFAADGTTVTLPNSQGCRDEFGGDPKGNPSGKGLFITDLMNNFCLAATLASFKSSERNLLENLLPDVEEVLENIKHPKLILLDRGYPSFALFKLLITNSLYFVARIQASSNTVKDFIGSGQKEQSVEIPAPKEYIRSHGDSSPIRVRLIRIHLKSGETEVLVTNLTETQMDYRYFKALYAMRWGVETDIDVFKNILQLEVFSGIRPICVRQDFNSKIIAFNINAMVNLYAVSRVREKANEKDSKVLIVNNNVEAGLMKNKILIILRTDTDMRENIERLLKELCRHTIPIKEGRSHPRKWRRLKVWGKYITLTNYKRAI